MSSYNTAVRHVNENLAEFFEEYTRSGIPNPITVEDINAHNLRDCLGWRHRLRRVLRKYYEHGNRPACIVLLGLEASSVFFSFDDPELKRTPVVVGMRSSAIVKIPALQNLDIVEWDPESYDLTKDFNDYNIVGGELYYYDVKRNLDLIKRFYPKCNTITFMTDNTLRGVTMHALFKKYAQKDNRFDVNYIDGRKMSMIEADETISNMPPSQALLLGTWSVDNSNSYVVRNSTYTFGQTNPKLPTFTFTDVAMGHWPVAGYSPRYHVMGRTLADKVVEFLKTGRKKPVGLVENRYVFDLQRLNMLKLSLEGFSFNYDVVNEPLSVFEEYRDTILFVTVLIIVLVSALAITLHLLRKSRRLSAKLVKQGKELLVAKYNAEEANQTKSRFIASISHEIRTPLNAVLGFSQLFANDQIEMSAEERKQYADLIMTNGNMLLKLIDDVLEVSKIEAGKLKFNIGEQPSDDRDRPRTPAAGARQPHYQRKEVYGEGHDNHCARETAQGRHDKHQRERHGLRHTEGEGYGGVRTLQQAQFVQAGHGARTLHLQGVRRGIGRKDMGRHDVHRGRTLRVYASYTAEETIGVG